MMIFKLNRSSTRSILSTCLKESNNHIKIIPFSTLKSSLTPKNQITSIDKEYHDHIFTNSTTSKVATDVCKSFESSLSSLYKNIKNNKNRYMTETSSNLFINPYNNLKRYTCYSTSATSASTTNTHNNNTEQQKEKVNNIDNEQTIDNNQQQSQQQQPQKKQSPFAFMRKGYFNLVKFPISIYVTFTTVAGYVMTAPIIDPVALGLVSLGTFLASASASAYNQEMEVPYDAKMPRTKSRPLVTGEIKRDTGFNVAMGASILGCAILVPVNPISAALAMSNILLYILYTQMKRTTPWNTWVGAFVGAIPPLIGSVAGAGGFEPVGWLLATVLYIWQIPHFLALAEKLKSQYAMAGYKMLSVTHPHLNYPVSFWHAIAGVVAPFAFQYFSNLNMTTTTVAFFSLSSAIMAVEAVLENRYKQKAAEALKQGIKLPPQSRNRGVFFLSLLMLPLSLIIGMIFRLPYEYYYVDADEEENDNNNGKSKILQQS